MRRLSFADRMFSLDIGTGRRKREGLAGRVVSHWRPGEVDAAGNWRIIGRIKNLIILGSGHNIAPEPIEDEVLRELPRAQQVVLVGNGRGYLSALCTGDVNPGMYRPLWTR